MLALVVLLGISNMPTTNAEVKLEGNTFISVASDSVKTKDTGTKTKYTWKDKKGNEYPIYLSKNGKAYIIRVSKNTGKEYKQYLPEVTAKLNESV